MRKCSSTVERNRSALNNDRDDDWNEIGKTIEELFIRMSKIKGGKFHFIDQGQRKTHKKN